MPSSGNGPASITFAIPFYSKPEYLRAAIESVLKQDRSDWRLLVCDNDSPVQGIREMVESYARQFPEGKIRYTRNERNLGLSGNCNRCLDLAETDLVNLLHSDDELLPNYASTMIAAFGKNPEATAIFCQTKIIDSEGRQVFSVPDFVKQFLFDQKAEQITLSGEEGLTALLGGNFIMAPSLAFRKSKLKSRRFGDTYRFVMDVELTSGMLLDGETLVGVNVPAYAYRRHDASTSACGLTDLDFFAEEVEIFGKLSEKAAQKGWNRAAARGRRKTILRLQVGYYALKDLARLRAGAGLKKLRYLGTFR